MSDSEEKKIRTCLSAEETFWMCLMPISNISFWYLLLARVLPLRTSLMIISGFYTSWALKKVVGGDKNEKGHLSYGTLLVGAALQIKLMELLGVTAVGASITYVLNLLGGWPLRKIAYVFKKSVLWATIFKGYLISMLIQVAYVGFMVYHAD